MTSKSSRLPGTSPEKGPRNLERPGHRWCLRRSWRPSAGAEGLSVDSQALCGAPGVTAGGSGLRRVRRSWRAAHRFKAPGTVSRQVWVCMCVPVWLTWIHFLCSDTLIRQDIDYRCIDHLDNNSDDDDEDDEDDDEG